MNEKSSCSQLDVTIGRSKKATRGIMKNSKLDEGKEINNRSTTVVYQTLC